MALVYCIAFLWQQDSQSIAGKTILLFTFGFPIQRTQGRRVPCLQTELEALTVYKTCHGLTLSTYIWRANVDCVHFQGSQ
ncbi:hypothetical protein BCR43DRAFT_494793 [Syncephalastrum racemosum]|uniref:Uncharacterized protein n=1 Tax=Syncephalastrum racemosum TaxID=13706 RepID=A0A1X2H8K1_SYNRA|nr:hypothetical protein BCR43DRAFT_494774 [Syncephalastrum racemosum]ORY94909.1 hypothetical protein BCR43DRAFT_494793 [Syncephalastrum racemosum]